VKALLEFNDRHPVLTGILGSLGSIAGAIGSWYLDHRDAITDWAAHVSAVGGAVIFLGTISVKGVAWLRRRWTATAPWRRRWKRHTPSDDHFQTPGTDA
jgi:membrane associated rhomboid family serine protease